MADTITQKFIDLISRDIIGSAIEIHKELGPGLLESAYERCLKYSLEQKGYQVKSQVELPIIFKDLVVENAYRLDLLVDDLIIVELKSVEEITDVHRAQILTYLKFTEKPKGILINFKCSNIFYKGQETFVTKEYAKLARE